MSVKKPSKFYREQYKRIALARTVQGRKWCWVATETRLGWRMKLCIGDKLEYPLRGLVLRNPGEVQAIVGKSAGVVFIHMRNTAWREVNGKFCRVSECFLNGEPL